ncbi:MAG: response regulator transcription factor [Acidobacteria bacterium]|nr:response regulator transcription factor [Acidobacteriota bacterium]MCW5968319.1 response regulator transcription factor [Blastocatellales bacterium]
MTTQTEREIRILLIDDHVIVRAGLKLVIESRSGLVVVGEAGDGEQALELAKQTSPDIILLDLDLGDTSGLDLLPELLSIVPEAKVIILTGLKDLEVHRQAVRLGAMGVVMKEKAVEVVINAVERVSAGEVWLDPRLTASLLSDFTRGNRPAKVDPEAGKIAALSKREREVVELVGEGLKNKEIAERLFISEITVRHHLTSIFEKLDLSDRIELMLYAYRHGLAKAPQ